MCYSRKQTERSLRTWTRFLGGPIRFPLFVQPSRTQLCNPSICPQLSSCLSPNKQSTWAVGYKRHSDGAAFPPGLSLFNDYMALSDDTPVNSADGPAVPTRPNLDFSLKCCMLTVQPPEPDAELSGKSLAHFVKKAKNIRSQIQPDPCIVSIPYGNSASYNQFQPITISVLVVSHTNLLHPIIPTKLLKEVFSTVIPVILQFI